MTASKMVVSPDSGNSGILLSLPQSDLPNKPTKPSTSSITATKKADLVLFQLPTSEQFQKDLYEGNCQILANSKSASLVSSTTSYKLVTVGTSNTLVVWKDGKKPKKNKIEDDDDPSLSTPTKRIKPTSLVTSCRLIQPGGSGASFLVGQQQNVNPNDLCRWFEQRRQQHNGTAGGMVATSTLCNLFQASKVEILSALSKVAIIVAIQQSSEEQYWQLVPDEEVMLGQRALTELLVEETMLEDYNTALRLEDVANGISERLLQLLWDQDTKVDAHLGTNEERSLAIARKTAFLAQTNQSKRSYSSKMVHLDPDKVWYQNVTNLWYDDMLQCFNSSFFIMLCVYVCGCCWFLFSTTKVAFYVLRDLFLQCPNYVISDLVQKWEARLPMGEIFEKCMTLEWLQECGLVPDQLVVENPEGKPGSSSNNPSSSLRWGGKVIRLVSSDMVLTWKE
jgi:Sister chromatid cohesion protein Dcc1